MFECSTVDQVQCPEQLHVNPFLQGNTDNYEYDSSESGTQSDSDSESEPDSLSDDGEISVVRIKCAGVTYDDRPKTMELLRQLGKQVKHYTKCNMCKFIYNMWNSYSN